MLLILLLFVTVQGHDCHYSHSGGLAHDLRHHSKAATCTQSSLRCHRIGHGSYCIAENITIDHHHLYIDCGNTGALDWSPSAFGWGSERWLFSNITFGVPPVHTYAVQHPVYFTYNMYGAPHPWHAFEDLTHFGIAMEAYELESDNLQVVVIDPSHSLNQTMHPYLDVWQALSRRHPVQSLADFANGVLRLRKAIFGVHGGISVLTQELAVQSRCRPSGLLTGLMSNVRASFSLPPAQRKIYLLRRLMANAQTSSRRISNEEALTARLQELGVLVVDMAELSARDQVELALSTKTMIGLHGAGFAWGFFMTPPALLVEIVSTYTCECFNNVAGWMGHAYARVNAAYPGGPVDIEAVVRAARLV